MKRQVGLGYPRFKSTPYCKLRAVHHNHHTALLQRHLSARRVWAGLLVLALLWTQSMGLWHRLVHSGRGHPATGAMVRAATANDAAPALSTPSGPSGKLFSNHQTDTDCQLFDQLSHADGVIALLAIAPALLVSPQFLRASHALAVARWHALFQARGPPSVR